MPLAWAADAKQSAVPSRLAAQSPADTTVKVYRQMVNGVTSYSDRPPVKGNYVVLSASCFACSLTSTINWDVVRLYRHEYADTIEVAAQQHGLDPALVRAVIHAESGFNPAARSKKGATGLMQLMPQTARMLGVTNALMPEHNIRGGTQYLASLLAQFQGDVKLATAAYNAGPGAVVKYAGIPPYDETRVYVQRVQILHRRYREAGRG
jgi:soluble lytic murein transglycosylase-like protein